VEAIDQDIKATRDQIDLLTDQREDTSLEFRRLTRVYVQEILQDKITAAKRAGNKKKAAQIQKEIDDWNQVRTQEWDQDRSIIDAKAKSRQLQRERARGLEERLIERLKEQGLQKPVAELEEGLRLLDQVADLDAQEVDLEKQLNAAREQYDYTTANQVRVKLKDIRSKYGDLFKQATEKMKRIQGAPPAPELEQQNL